MQYATDVSPVKAMEADLDRNLIVVGGSARNSVRARYVQARLPSAILTGEDRVPIDWATVAAAPGGTTVFFCTGMRADASWAATEYLIRNWKALAAEFGDSEFVVCLGFPKTEEYLDEYSEPLRLSMGAGSDPQVGPRSEGGRGIFARQDTGGWGQSCCGASVT